MFNKFGRSAARVKYRVCRGPTLPSPQAARLASAAMTKPPAGMLTANGYAKPPFAGPAAVLAYLARYAIANSRMIRLDDLGVRSTTRITAATGAVLHDDQWLLTMARFDFGQSLNWGNPP
jgi:hypothetical protein